MPNTLEKTFSRLQNALSWRLHRLLGDRVVYGTLLGTARFWRRMLKKPVFIGVTGSAGKTMTKELLLGMLSHKGKGVGNFSSYNNIEEIAKPMLRLRPTHSFFATELTGDKPGGMDKSLALVQPSIGIVTVVRDDHSSKEYPREAIAQEKSKLIASLPATGTAVLNADDELVLAMAAKSAAEIITYGLSLKAELRAEEISSTWPERLQMTLIRGSERVKLRTQLCGTHWIPSVLGAIGGGLATGMTLTECAKGIASVAPFDGRMQPVTTPDGMTFIRDDYKAPLWTVDACFEFMKAAQAKRKIIVIGSLSDHSTGTGASKKYAEVAQRAQQIADFTVFVGSWAFGPEQCILIFDDLDLPLGTVKTRLNGGAGGHRGVDSILEAFQTDAIRRVKVGVGKAGGVVDRISYVLTAFDEDTRLAIEQSILTAEARLLEMMLRPKVTQPH